MEISIILKLRFHIIRSKPARCWPLFTCYFKERIWDWLSFLKSSICGICGSKAWSSDDEILPLKFCLMSISLPWEYIVYDLLFKVKSLFLLLYSSMKIGSILDCGIVLLFTRSFFISIIFLILLLAVPIGKLKLSVAILGYEHYLSMFILLLGAGTDFLTCTKRVLIHLIIAISGKSSKYTTLSFVKIYKGPSDRLQVEIKCGINNFRMISFSGTCNLSCG